MDARQQKAALRQTVLTRLKAKPGAQRAADSAALRAQLSPILAELEIGLCRTLNIALYAALPHEVDLLPLLQEHPQHRYAFPRCHKERLMRFHVVSSPADELCPGAMGILTPLPHLPEMPPQSIDLLLVPGVAFTAEGARLGYGGGYYDSFIPRCPQARLLALAFEEQMVDALPTEAHDLRLPHLILSATSKCHKSAASPD